jgi:N-acetylneuraminic acid mutarotase
MKTELFSMSTLLAVCLGLPTDFQAAEPSWSTQSPLPSARYGLTTCVVDGKIYAMGGGDSPYTQFLSVVEVYDPATDSWAPGVSMPRDRMGHAAAVVGGKIYVMGGGYQAQTSTATVDEYDPVTGAWAAKASMPIDRAFHCAAAVDGKIYVFGGVRSGWSANAIDVPNVDVYDPATDQWTTKGKMRLPRGMAAAAVVNGKVYVFGGIVGNLSGANGSTADIYDPATDSWKSIPGLVARSWSGICAVGDKIYLLGSGYMLGLLNRADIYDTATGTWQSGPKLSKAKCGMGASFAGGKLYIFGGGDVAWPWHAIATVEAYTPPPALSITRQGGSMTLSWTGILQELDGPLGSQWRDIPSAPASPWTIDAAHQSQMNCFRSRLP